MAKKEKRLSLRDLIHILGSKHQAFILGSGMIQANLKELLQSKSNPQDYKQIIKDNITNLERLTKMGKEADNLLDEIKGMVYKKIDPDKILASASKRP